MNNGGTAELTRFEQDGADGLVGGALTLKDAGDNGFTLTVTQKVKPEGKKRPELVETDMSLAYDEIKYTKNIITV